jgi:hypothetical protein
MISHNIQDLLLVSQLKKWSIYLVIWRLPVQLALLMYWQYSLFYLGDTCEIETLLTVNTNADPTSPISAKIRWNIDECYEIILLLKAKVL